MVLHEYFVGHACEYKIIGPVWILGIEFVLIIII
jgi:hypothetical protein